MTKRAPSTTSGRRKGPSTAPTVTQDTPLGGYVDLGREDVRDKQGRRIDEAYTERLVEAARKAPGRPSLSRGTSPSVAFRLPPDLRARAAELAAREGKSVSQLAREALEALLARSA